MYIAGTLLALFDKLFTSLLQVQNMYIAWRISQSGYISAIDCKWNAIKLQACQVMMAQPHLAIYFPASGTESVFVRGRVYADIRVYASGDIGRVGRSSNEKVLITF
jgi:hypothetical protein